MFEKILNFFKGGNDNTEQADANLSSEDKNKKDWNHLFKLIESGKSEDAMNFLNDHPNIDLNDRNEKGQTLLHVSVLSRAKPDLMMQLVEKGADIRREDHSGKTPIDLLDDLSKKNDIMATGVPPHMIKVFLSMGAMRITEEPSQSNQQQSQSASHAIQQKNNSSER